ncbi:MAG: F0F1 ATP synthase subunit A [Bacteroidales bacterium]|jgi:F-type H+-transporting ATPase subunit a|nr:F0F1 ATP synthase subunit A [Bacteroidales bacterium]
MKILSFLRKSKAGIVAVLILAVLVFSMIMSTSVVFAGNEKEYQGEDDALHEDVEEAELQAGKIIIDHLIDSHEWHLWTYKGHHVSIPLPVLLIHDGEFHAFWSNKLAHGHRHNGFYIESEGKNKGKIVRDVQHGMVDNEIIAETGITELPLDLSITKNVFSILFSSVLLIIIFTSVAKTYRRREGKAPKGLQSFMEPVIIFVRDDIARSSIGEKKYERYMPFLLTLFFFIFLNNLLGIVPFFPGGANVTGNIAVTGVMAVFTFLITSFSGNRQYWTHIINTPGVPWWLKFPVPLMPIVEIMGVFTKPFVLMVRLFANITAGHTIILGFISLIFIFGNVNQYAGLGGVAIAVPFAIFMYLLELLVAFIQAYVFTLLSALYFGMAIEEHH